MPVPWGSAALDHEAGDDPVEDQAVIEALVDEADEVAHADCGAMSGYSSATILPPSSISMVTIGFCAMSIHSW